MPIRVPLVPRPATKWVISGQSLPDLRPGALVVGTRVGVVGVLVQEAPLEVLRRASARGPLDGAVASPRGPGVRMISAPNTSSIWRRSIADARRAAGS